MILLTLDNLDKELFAKVERPSEIKEALTRPTLRQRRNAVELFSVTVLI